MQDLAYIPSLSLVSASSFAMSDFAIECRLDMRWSGTSLAVLANLYPERRLVRERAFSGRGQSIRAVVLLDDNERSLESHKVGETVLHY